MAKMYFIAVVAPADINAQVLQWKHYMRDHYGCTVALRSPAHITLIPPFWMNEELEKELLMDVDSFALQQPSFHITLKNFDAFKPRVIFVGIQENASLQQLKSSLEHHLVSLQKYPIKKESRPFHPHLTIANRDLRKKDFYPAFEHFSSIDYTQHFSATSIAILKHDGIVWQIHHTAELNK
jgi:2'-5' RNA ligase